MVKENTTVFSIDDFCIFYALLISSIGIGFYFWVKRNCRSTDYVSIRDYLMGKGHMRELPITFSLLACYISGMTMLGAPTEIYRYGCEFAFMIFSLFLSILMVLTIYMPVFYKLQVHTACEYLEIRFSKTVRNYIALMFIVDQLICMPMILYVPSNSFSEVSGLNLYVIGTMVVTFCSISCLLGGYEGGIWADTLQTIVMFLAFFMVVLIGSSQLGGFTHIWNKAIVHRLHIANLFDLDLTKRNTAINVLFGQFCYWLSYGSSSQIMVQRYLSVSTYKKAQGVIIKCGLLALLFMGGTNFFGLILYAMYKDCDPYSAKRIKEVDQSLIIFTVDIEKELAITGLLGFFVSGVFGSSMSSFNVGVNATALVILEDIVKPLRKKPLREAAESVIARLTVIVLAVWSVLLMTVIKMINRGVLGVGISLSSAATSTTCGVFTLGMMFPWSNKYGALLGGIVGFGVTMTLGVAEQLVVYFRWNRTGTLKMSIAGCSSMLNASYKQPKRINGTNIFLPFKISHNWLAIIGLVTVITVGMITSIVTGPTKLKNLDPDLISPVVHYMLPKEAFKNRGKSMDIIGNKRHRRYR